MKSVTRLFAPASRILAARTAFPASRICAATAISALRTAPAIRSLSTTRIALGNGSVDSDLSHTLAEEIDYEIKQAAEEGVPEFIQAFSNKTGFKLKTTVGSNQVVMTKQFGTEIVTVSFDTSEILNAEDPIADIEVYRENEDGEAVKEAEKKSADTPEDFPINFTATFAKPGAPVLHMELETEEGEIGVNHMMFVRDQETAVSSTVEADWARRQAYFGPIYGQLSDDLKDNIDEFFTERGIDTALTLFMQDYIEYKEQTEYLNWLQNFKKFIDA
ncbi:Mitochondrial acidic protein mam33 [Linderina macrospora]|uniref:Mitochondrial acidic protein mam33 n=1 Tax=Linderina macrospora TaxID=4868 RepID=A0ACC1JCB3_9FUNG|nr:Mitochondrial acidic protein mam33 [Linderina macrospora]